MAMMMTMTVTAQPIPTSSVIPLLYGKPKSPTLRPPTISRKVPRVSAASARRARDRTRDGRSGLRRVRLGWRCGVVGRLIHHVSSPDNGRGASCGAAPIFPCGSGAHPSHWPRPREILRDLDVLGRAEQRGTAGRRWRRPARARATTPTAAEGPTCRRTAPSRWPGGVECAVRERNRPHHEDGEGPVRWRRARRPGARLDGGLSTTSTRTPVATSSSDNPDAEAETQPADCASGAWSL